ncbi:hypothetical protein L4X63_18415 [Geomonas sp. Red32]|uniref:hypothetical protein n=1 Tax=Geomonas sp. Red32 TaxID=2912856 RepID=UPI00202CC400|nr:hypothetical protein [Geomonas sp. Red32]MCM0083563.1 hypothetical protein [Geomonas sp. Red32]
MKRRVYSKREAIVTAGTIVVALAATCAWGSTGPGSQGDRQPPKEAFEACVGLTEGASAEAKGRNGEVITGTCKAFGSGSALALVPDRPPQDGGGNPPGGMPPVADETRPPQ